MVQEISPFRPIQRTAAVIVLLTIVVVSLNLAIPAPPQAPETAVARVAARLQLTKIRDAVLRFEHDEQFFPDLGELVKCGYLTPEDVVSPYDPAPVTLARTGLKSSYGLVPDIIQQLDPVAFASLRAQFAGYSFPTMGGPGTLWVAAELRPLHRAPLLGQAGKTPSPDELIPYLHAVTRDGEFRLFLDRTDVEPGKRVTTMPEHVARYHAPATLALSVEPLAALRGASEDTRPLVMAAGVLQFSQAIEPGCDIDVPVSQGSALTVRVALEQLSSLQFLVNRVRASPVGMAPLSRECPVSLVAAPGAPVPAMAREYTLLHDCAPVVIAAADAWARLGYRGTAIRFLAELLADGGIRDIPHLLVRTRNPAESAQNLHAVDFAGTRIAVWERIRAWTPYRGQLQPVPGLDPKSGQSQSRMESLALLTWWSTEGIRLYPLDVREPQPVTR